MGVITGIERFAGVGSSGDPEFLGGFRAGGWGASWPFVRLTFTAEGFRLSPTWRWLALVGVPRFDVPWSDVRRVEALVGPLGGVHGIRFILQRRLHKARRLGHTYRPVYVRRPIVGLLPRDVDRALSGVPEGIPVGTSRGFIVWP
jgi:hypothetical protein